MTELADASPRPRVWTLAELEADPIPAIETFRDAEPWLHWGGMFNMPFERRRAPGADERLANSRAEMTDSWRVEQLLRAAQFIDQAPRIASVNRKRSTYGWKHIAERFHQARATDQSYVGEGMFIVAARAMGLRVWRSWEGQHFVSLSERAAAEV